MDFHRDLPSSLVKWRRGQLGLREWAGSLRRVTSYATFDRRDPKPFAATLVHLASAAVGPVLGPPDGLAPSVHQAVPVSVSLGRLGQRAEGAHLGWQQRSGLAALQCPRPSKAELTGPVARPVRR